MKIKTREITVFAMLGAIMFVTKVIMELLPNVHLTGALIVAYTIVYRKKALYPIYTFVLLNGIIAGFATWWIPYLYVWFILWGVVMILPKNMPTKVKPFVYMLVSGLHGILFGVLYAPAQAIIFGLDIKGMISWIVAGLPFDVIHGISNFICGILIMPIVKVLIKLENAQ
ncbi:MAG: hypothetical protein E7262_07045 [Lachnospiraceae bacterium]|nr:hypothetical protein [Lachnospiraceae bacterium]